MKWRQRLAVGSLLFLATASLADQAIDPRLVARLRAEAAILSKVASDRPPPLAFIVPRETLCKLSARQSHCDILGTYLTKIDTIFVSDSVDLSTRAGQSILVHELVHELRRDNPYTYGITCEREELAAYFAQMRFLGDDTKAVRSLIPDTMTIKIWCLPPY